MDILPTSDAQHDTMIQSDWSTLELYDCLGAFQNVNEIRPLTSAPLQQPW